MEKHSQTSDSSDTGSEELGGQREGFASGKKRRGFLLAQYFFALCLILMTIYWMRDVRWDMLERIPGIVMLEIVAISLIQHLVSPLVPWLALLSMGHGVRFWPLLLILNSSVSANYLVPGRIGIPARAWLQKKLLGVPFSGTAAGMVIETAAGLGIFCLAGGLGAFLIMDMDRWEFAGIALLGLLVSGWLAARFRRGRAGTSNPSPETAATSDNSFFSRIRRFWLSTKDHLKKARTDLVLLCFALTLGNLSLSALRGVILAQGVGSHVPFFSMMAVLSIAYIAGQVSGIPMGLGSRDLTMGAMLSLAGVDKAGCLAFILVNRGVTTGLKLFLSGLCAAIISLRWHVLSRDVPKEKTAQGKGNR